MAIKFKYVFLQMDRMSMPCYMTRLENVLRVTQKREKYSLLMSLFFLKLD